MKTSQSGRHASIMKLFVLRTAVSLLVLMWFRQLESNYFPSDKKKQPPIFTSFESHVYAFLDRAYEAVILFRKTVIF